MGNKAQAVGSVEYTKQGGTYFIKMVSDFGDIRQKYASYDVNNNEASGIVPDFTNPVQQPTIEAYITNSKKGAEVYPNNAKWTANGVELTFGEDGISTQNFCGETGHFKYIAADAKKKTRAGLKILKNLVVPFNATPVLIEFVGIVADGNNSKKIPGSYTIPVLESTSNGMMVRISASNGGILDKDHASIKLKANIDDTGGAIISNPTYAWEATGDSGDFEALGVGYTGKEITVNLADVSNSRLYKVTVAGIGSDVQRVEDHTDELRVVPNPTPPEEEIVEGSNGNVTWAPKMYRGETLINSGVTFSMKFYNPAGTPINVATQFCITEDEVAQNGGANYVITGLIQQ